MPVSRRKKRLAFVQQLRRIRLGGASSLIGSMFEDIVSGRESPEADREALHTLLFEERSPESDYRDALTALVFEESTNPEFLTPLGDVGFQCEYLSLPLDARTALRNLQHIEVGSSKVITKSCRVGAPASAGKLGRNIWK